MRGLLERSWAPRFTIITAITLFIVFQLLSGCASLLQVTTPPGQASSPSVRSVSTSATGATLTSGPIAFPSGFISSVKSYGALGNGVTDDTAAIQRALSDGRTSASETYNGVPKALYFPPGIYLVSKTLNWIGCCVTLQGSGSTSTEIRLASSSPGFNNAASPVPVIETPGGNESFRQNIRDMAISVGADNPGAIALSYISNNSGAVEDVWILSEDKGAHTGIDMTRDYAGPLMLNNVEVDGFSVGMDLNLSEYSVTMEGITLKNQTLVGIRDVSQPLNIRNLVSVNSVPAITNKGGFVVLLDASLTGGNTANPAIQTNSAMYVRSVSENGYAETLLDESGSTPVQVTGTIAEHLVGKPLGLATAANPVSLNLPIEETPSYSNSDLSTWASFKPQWYGDTSELQTVLNSGASTIYFPVGPNVTAGYPAGAYFSYSEAQVTVPDTVDRIIGFSSIINGDNGGGTGGIDLLISSNSTTPLIIEQFGYGLRVDHRGSRPVVIEHSGVSYTSYPGAGSLYLDDVQVGAFTVQPGQHVWARQLNDEVAQTKITNDGGSLWILGLKTEQPDTVINTTAGGSTELLGALIYPATTTSSSNIGFSSTDSNVSYIYDQLVYCTGCGYAIQVQETRSGVTRQIISSDSATYRMPLFVGYQ